MNRCIRCSRTVKAIATRTYFNLERIVVVAHQRFPSSNAYRTAIAVSDFFARLTKVPCNHCFSEGVRLRLSALQSTFRTLAACGPWLDPGTISKLNAVTLLERAVTFSENRGVVRENVWSVLESNLAHSARADMYRRLGRTAEARSSYEKALALTQQEPERQFLQERIRPFK
jgi:tetratricopeptide (TPR) repeat protein